MYMDMHMQRMHIYTYMSLCNYVYMCVYVHVYVYVHTYMHIEPLVAQVFVKPHPIQPASRLTSV